MLANFAKMCRILCRIILSSDFIDKLKILLIQVIFIYFLHWKGLRDPPKAFFTLPKYSRRFCAKLSMHFWLQFSNSTNPLDWCYLVHFRAEKKDPSMAYTANHDHNNNNKLINWPPKDCLNRWLLVMHRNSMTWHAASSMCVYVAE